VGEELKDGDRCRKQICKTVFEARDKLETGRGEEVIDIQKSSTVEDTYAMYVKHVSRGQREVTQDKKRNNNG